MRLPVEGRERASYREKVTVLPQSLNFLSPSFPFALYFPEKGTRQFLRLLFLHGFLIKVMNELRIDKKRQMVFGLCIVLVKCIFH